MATRPRSTAPAPAMAARALVDWVIPKASARTRVCGPGRRATGVVARLVLAARRPLPNLEVKEEEKGEGKNDILVSRNKKICASTLCLGVEATTVLAAMARYRLFADG